MVLFAVIDINWRRIPIHNNPKGRKLGTYNNLKKASVVSVL